MSLINYIEPTNIGNVFAGLGSLLILSVMAYILYRVYIKFAQWIDVIINKESKYAILEEKYLDRVAKKDGVDLDSELIKRSMIYTPTKSFRGKVEDQVYEEMFGKVTKEKEEKKGK